jgi:fructose-1,6-bisphosphatase II
MDRNLALEAVRVTEAAALYASRYMGRGDDELANDTAVEAMARAFSSVSIDGKIIIGEAGKPDNLLERGKGTGNKNGITVDIALDPLDGKSSCASGGQNTISSIAIGEKGAFFGAPSIYMEKVAVGKVARGSIDITQPPEINIKRIARAMDKYIEDLTVCVLDRERHEDLIKHIRTTGARIKLIKDGDISGAIAAAMENSSIDILMGVGGAREGILAAAAIKCLGGDIQARFVYRNDEDREMVLQAGEKDLNKIYMINDLVRGQDIMFSATGVTDGELLKGVRFYSGGAETHSIVMRAKTHTLRLITALHYFDYKPMY